MNLDTEIAQRIKSKVQPETPSPHSRIEEIGARLAELNRQHHELDELITQFDNGGDDDRKLIETGSEAAMKHICDDMETLVEALAMERPATAREILICALYALSPLQEAISAIPEKAEYETAMGSAVSRLLRGMIPALEALSGTSRAELGCGDSYYSDYATAGDLIEGLKVPLKTEASIPLHEMLQSRLCDVFLAWKAFNDAGEDDDSPIGAPLCQRAQAAEKKIRDLTSNDAEVLIAKLIISMNSEIRNDDPAEAHFAPEAARAGLRLFGLEEFYDECYGDGSAAS
jgi:hypothetical protein